MKLRERLARFFYPPADSPRWLFVLPYLTLGLLTLLFIGGGVYGWEYTNSPQFCGTACHTMPPQDTVYKLSPHANVTCEECHIGRASFFNQLSRKTQGLKETYYEVFKLYEYPLYAKALRPARDTCEKCHQPETFSDDSLRVLSHFADDEKNTQTSLYLILKTGGGAKREGLGRGIHWHIVNKVEYYATDELAQDIPYVRVTNDDGTTTEYVDVESGFDPSTLDKSKLVSMDCVTCHNRVTHDFQNPAKSVDTAMSRGQIALKFQRFIKKQWMCYLSSMTHGKRHSLPSMLWMDITKPRIITLAMSNKFRLLCRRSRISMTALCSMIRRSIGRHTRTTSVTSTLRAVSVAMTGSISILSRRRSVLSVMCVTRSRSFPAPKIS